MLVAAVWCLKYELRRARRALSLHILNVYREFGGPRMSGCLEESWYCFNHKLLELVDLVTGQQCPECFWSGLLFSDGWYQVLEQLIVSLTGLRSDY